MKEKESGKQEENSTDEINVAVSGDEGTFLHVFHFFQGDSHFCADVFLHYRFMA